MAIAYHPKFEYVAVDVSGDVYIVANDLLSATAEKCAWQDYRVIARFPGARLNKPSSVIHFSIAIPSASWATM